MSYRFSAAITGSLRKAMDAEIAAARRAVSAAVDGAAVDLKNEMRQQVRNAGLGNRLANAIRHQTFPKGQPSLSAASYVYSNAPKLTRVFGEGAVIRSANKFFLAIPTENAPKRGVGGKRISPFTFPEHAYGPLRYVFRKGKPGLLVADNLRARKGKRGGFARASKRDIARENVASAVMFVLVPQVRIAKRIDFDGPSRRILAQLPARIAREWERFSEMEGVDV